MKIVALVNDVLDFSKIESGKLELGNTEYLTKPIEPLKLEQMLIRFLPEELVELTEE